MVNIPPISGDFRDGLWHRVYHGLPHYPLLVRIDMAWLSQGTRSGRSRTVLPHSTMNMRLR